MTAIESLLIQPATSGTQRGSYALGAYYRGWAKRDGAAARDDLDRRARAAGSAIALAIAYATIVIGPTPSDVARLHQLLAAGMLDRTQVAAMIGAMGTVRKWIDGLGESAFERLMVALAGPDCDNADRVIKLLSLEDIVEVMPEIDLPDKKRRALERALPAWLGE